MGREGYLINQFAARTNRRTTLNGAARHANRMRLPVEIVRRTREAVGRLHRHLPPVHARTWWRTASRWDEMVQLPLSRLPQPHHQHRHRLARGARAHHRHQGAARPSPGSPKMKRRSLGILITTNRINMPEVAEASSPVARPTWSRWRARCWPIRRVVRPPGPRRGHQHLHRLQSGLPRSRLREHLGLLPGQPSAPATRPKRGPVAPTSALPSWVVAPGPWLPAPPRWPSVHAVTC